MTIDEFIQIQETALRRYYNAMEPASPKDVQIMDDIMADLANHRPFNNAYTPKALQEYLTYLDTKYTHANTEVNHLQANEYKKAFEMTHQVIEAFNKPLAENLNLSAIGFVNFVFSEYSEVWDILDVENGLHLQPRQHSDLGFDIYPNGDITMYGLATSRVNNAFVIQFLSQSPSQWFDISELH